MAKARTIGLYLEMNSPSSKGGTQSLKSKQAYGFTR